MATEQHISGSKAVIESLLAEGVDTFFGYPGGQIILVYDALYDYRDRIKHILTRHEQGAVHAAQGYARANGKVGVCMVTSGPGATNVVTGLADAMLDSTPIVVISGQVPSSSLGTDAFQETNFVGITQAITKWSCQVKRAEDIPSAIAKAFYIASTGRPGPVVVDITKDAQNGLVENFSYNKVNFIRSYNPKPAVDKMRIAEAARLINLARRPMVLVGQGVMLGNAEKELLAFIEKSGIPVASTLLGLSVVPSNHPLYVGMLGMHGNYAPNILNKNCDLIIAIGMRFSDRVTGKIDKFAINAQVIHMDIDPAEINKNIYADVPVIGDAKKTLPMLTEMIAPKEYNEWLEEFRKCYNVEYADVVVPATSPATPLVKMGEVASHVSEAYQNDAILVTDVGQQQMAAARYFRYTHPRSIVTSGGLGTMGFGLPAAMGAALACPNRDVCLFVGDGGLQMTIQELATISQHKIPVKIILLNNSFLGMVRQWQDLFYQKRYSFTDMVNPDFALIAQGYGIPYKCVETHEGLDDAINEMKATQGPFFLEVRVEREENIFPMIPPGAAVTDIRLE